MTANRYSVPDHYAASTRLNAEQLDMQRTEAAQNPEQFWRKMGERLQWSRPFTRVKDVSFAKEDLHIRWFDDGELNVAVNCIDRHLPARAAQTAIIFEADEPTEKARHISYAELSAEVNRLANGLRELGAGKGDRITIYMPMIPEAAFAMLACARIGAIHSVVFGGFSPESLAGRIADCQSRFVITADEGLRGGKKIPLKRFVDEALTRKDTACVEKVVVFQRTGGTVQWHEGRDINYRALVDHQFTQCPAAVMSAEDPLFILYTSGSTGKPKGVLHTSAGYLAWVAYTHETVFDLRPGDVFWCTADVGWVTGHSYVVYGPLANGATTLMFEGVPQYPDWSRFWQVCDKHQVSIFYTAPTAIRALMRESESFVTGSSRSSIRLLGTVGEPINPEAWEWYHRVVGEGRCPIVDTWWQTETGGALMSPVPGAMMLKPGSATLPLPGIQAALVDANGAQLHGVASGNLILTDSWPGQMRTVYGDHQRFYETYFATYPGSYFTGDGARRDEDGYYWITGRVDDVLNVSGHRIGTAEVESALVAHHLVAEAAVVGYPHELKGQGIYAYVTLKQGVDAHPELVEQLRQTVQREIGAIAKPDRIQFTAGLPKTRSGKIMRRILRKIAENDYGNLGDISTLADPSVVELLIAQRING